MKIQAIKTDTTTMTESETAAVILRENDNDLANLIWKRLVQRSITMRADELKLNGCNKLKRDQVANRERALEMAHILAQSMGQTAWLWLAAAKQTVGFQFVAGWD